MWHCWCAECHAQGKNVTEWHETAGKAEECAISHLEETDEHGKILNWEHRVYILEKTVVKRD